MLYTIIERGTHQLSKNLLYTNHMINKLYVIKATGNTERLMFKNQGINNIELKNNDEYSIQNKEKNIKTGLGNKIK